MPRAVAQAGGGLRQTVDPGAPQAATGLPTHPFVRLQHNRLRPQRDEALASPPRGKDLRRVMETHLPRMRMAVLLRTGERWCGVTRACTARREAPPRRPLPSPALLAARMAQGTHRGVVALGHRAMGVSVDRLEYLSAWFRREDTLKAAKAILVHSHHGLARSRVWGH